MNRISQCMNIVGSVTIPQVLCRQHMALLCLERHLLGKRKILSLDVVSEYSSLISALYLSNHPSYFSRCVTSYSYYDTTLKIVLWFC